MFEVVGHQHRGAVEFLDNLTQRLQLHVVYVLEVSPLVVGVDRAVRQLQAFDSTAGGIECFQLMPGFEHGEHLFLHVLVHLARRGGHIDIDVVDDGRGDVEPVLGANGDAHVAQQRFDFSLRVWQRLVPEAAGVLAKPAVTKSAEGAPQPQAAVYKPHLPPEVDQRVGTGGAGQLDKHVRILVGHTGEGLRAFAPLPQAKRFQLCGLVRHDLAKRPGGAEGVHQPGHVLVVGGVDVSGRVERGDSLARVAHDGGHAHVAELRPLVNLIRPGVLRDAQRGQNQRR